MKRFVKILSALIIIIAAALIYIWTGGLNNSGMTEVMAVESDGGTNKATPTPTPEPVMTSLTAVYMGDAVVVGEAYDPEKLKVYASMSNSTLIQLKEGEYDVSETIVAAEGTNIFVAIYKGKTAKFYVTGKTLKSISVSCKQRSWGYLNAPDADSLTITALYSNGSTEQITKDYTMEPAIFKNPGMQKVTISYGGKSASFNVTVREPREVKTLSVSYVGGKPVAHQAVDRNNLIVTVVYNDAAYSSERVSTYDLMTQTFESAGENEIKVVFLGTMATTVVVAEQISPVSIRAEYTGEAVAIGTEYQNRDLHVYVKYNDGSEQETDEYSVHNKTIKYLGDNNTIRVYYKDLQATVTIEGKDYEAPDFKYVSEFTVKSFGREVTVSTAIPKFLEQDCVKGAIVKHSKLTKAYRKLKIKNGEYIGINYQFEDGDNEEYLPMTVRFELPEDFEPEKTELYYTPNYKSILAVMNKQITEDGMLEVTVFKTGAYMLVYDPDADYDEYAEQREEEESQEE